MEAVWRFDKVHDEDSDKVLEEMRETAVGAKMTKCSLAEISAVRRRSMQVRHTGFEISKRTGPGERPRANPRMVRRRSHEIGYIKVESLISIEY